MNASILLDHEPVRGTDRHLVRALLQIEGRAPDAGNRVPLNLSVVLDRSGSMAGPKLAYAREAARDLLSRVFPDDTTSVVAFDHDVRVVAPAARRKKQHALSSKVGTIEAGGTTNLSGGWMEGRTQVERHKAAKASNRVILMTDGLANVGVTDPRHLVAMVREALEQGVATSTIGFGQDFDEHLLRELADAGGGNTHYIEHPDQAPAVFQSELEELLGLSAQNLTVEVRLESGVELAAVHHSYPREVEDKVVRLRLGDLYASEPKQLLLELGAHAQDGQDTPLVTVALTGHVLTDEGGIEERTVTLPVSFSPAEGPVVNPEVRRTLVFLQAAAARRQALEDEGRGDFDTGARRLRSVAAMVREAGDDDQAVEEAEDLVMMAEMLEGRTFAAAERKYMGQRVYDVGRSKMGKAELLSRRGRKG